MLFKSFLFIHIAAGLLSIVLFWVPPMTKKGGRIHVLSGNIYIKAMWIVVVSAIIMCAMRISEGRYEMAMFLGFLSMITAKPLWLGIAILNKVDIRFWRTKRFLEVMILMTAILMLSLGALWWGQGASVLMIIFGLIGMTSLLDLSQTKNRLLKRNRVQTHMAEMIVSGIAGYTAFFAFGARQLIQELLSGYWAVVPWILPTIIGIISIQILLPRYDTKSQKKKNVVRETAGVPVKSV